MQNLQPYQQRALKEHQRLKRKVDLLTSFLQTPAFSKLSDLERELLTHQLSAMSAYEQIILMRISEFEMPDDTMVVFRRKPPPSDADPMGFAPIEDVCVPERRLGRVTIHALPPGYQQDMFFIKRSDLEAARPEIRKL